MNQCLRIALAAMLMLALSGASLANDEVKIRKSGLYRQQLRGGELVYLADPKTQLCFASTTSGTLTVIACRSLALRPEWRRILNWLQ